MADVVHLRGTTACAWVATCDAAVASWRDMAPTPAKATCPECLRRTLVIAEQRLQRAQAERDEVAAALARAGG